MILPSSSFIPILLNNTMYNSPVGGHSTELKTYQHIASIWFWPGMRREISKDVQDCHICQQNKSLIFINSSWSLYNHHLFLNKFGRYKPRFVEGLPNSNSFVAILVMVNRLTKYGHFIYLKHPFTTLTVATLFTNEIVKLHGTPSSIVSDRDKVFLSLFWK